MSTTTTTEAEEFARLALGSRAMKNRRVRRAIIARLLNENGAAQNGDDTEDMGEEAGEEQDLVRALIGSKLLRRRRVRRALFAHLLRSKDEYEADGEDDGYDDGDEGTDDDLDIARALIASRVLRRRRTRRAILAHLLSERPANA